MRLRFARVLVTSSMIAASACAGPGQAPADASLATDGGAALLPIVAPDAGSARAASASTASAGDRAPPVTLAPEEVPPTCRIKDARAEVKPIRGLTEAPVLSGEQTFKCGKWEGDVGSFELESPELAKEAVAKLGAGLWKGPRPGEEHPDELLLRGSVVVMVSGNRRVIRPLTAVLLKKGFALAHPPEVEPDEAEVAVMAERLGCKKGDHAPYCAALAAFAQGTPAATSIGPLPGRALDVVPTEKQRFETPALLHVADGRGDFRQSFWFDADGGKKAKRILKRLSTGKPLPPDDEYAVEVRAHRLDEDNDEATLQGKSLWIFHEATTFVREADGMLVAVARFPESGRFILGVFPKPAR